MPFQCASAPVWYSLLPSQRRRHASMIILQKSRQEHNNRVCVCPHASSLGPSPDISVDLLLVSSVLQIECAGQGGSIISSRRRPPLPSLRRLIGGGSVSSIPEVGKEGGSYQQPASPASSGRRFPCRGRVRCRSLRCPSSVDPGCQRSCLLFFLSWLAPPPPLPATVSLG